MLNPGDPKAIEAGCKCPSEPNQNGQGTFTSVQADPSKIHFVIEANCPLHGKANWRDEI